MPCQTVTSQTVQQPTTVLPQTLPQTQADWSRFLQRMNELLRSINNAQYATGINAVPTEYAVYDGTALPALRIAGATSAFDTSHVQFGAGSLQLTATASTVTVELAASGYPITLHPNWKWIASLFLLTSAPTIAGKLSIVTPAQQYDVDISGTPGASWSRLYGDYDLTADASTSCTLLLTLTGVTVGQVFNIEGWMLEPSQGAILPSPFIMTSGPRTWGQVVGSDAVDTNITTAQTTANTANASTTVYNSKFTSSLSGWSFDTNATGEWYHETGSNSPDGSIGTYLVHKGQSGQTTTAAHNIDGGAAVTPGQSISASIPLRSVGANAGSRAYVRIGWYDDTGTLISTSTGGVNECSPDAGYFTQGVSRVYGTAPSGAVRAVLEIEYDNHTSGYYTATNGYLSGQPATLDEVPDGSTYVRGASRNETGGAITIDNADCSLPANPDGSLPGWDMSSLDAGGLWYIDAGSPDSGYTQDYVIRTPVSASAKIWGAKKWNCREGDSVSVQVRIKSPSGVSMNAGVNFFNSAGTYLGGVVGSSSSTSWSTQSAVGYAPSGTAYARASIYCPATSGDHAYAALQWIRASVNDLRSAGSGARIGDQRNLPAVTFSNFGSGWNGLGLSYSATTTSATISASAATLQAGSVAINYNASSVTVSGSAGSTVKYYLYYQDPTHSGGAQTLQASTSVINALNNDGNVYLAAFSVTFPTSGTSTGTGVGLCPLRSAWVIKRGRNGKRIYVRAGKIREGDYILLINGAWGRVMASRAAESECVRLVIHGAGTLGCSVTAPIKGKHGDILAADALDEKVLIWRIDQRYCRVSAVHPLGMQAVQHISVEGPEHHFWTGDAKECLFAHHNTKSPYS